jgi:adenine-specific DNA-methyltransferase
VIKYIGSKRRLVPVLGALFTASGAKTALDLFAGTTRVAQEFKRRGAIVTAVDTARYSEAFARCYITTDSTSVDKDALGEAIDRLNRLPGHAGYFTDTFCVKSRYFQPDNGARVDAIRDVIEADYIGTDLYPILLTSLIEAADRVDSTTGLQMAYLKTWAPRAYNPLELRVPELFPGPGRAIRGDACELAGQVGCFDIAYLDPRITSIATLRIITPGRRWWPGAARSIMDSRVSGSTAVNRTPKASLMLNGRCLPPWPRS